MFQMLFKKIDLIKDKCIQRDVLVLVDELREDLHEGELLFAKEKNLVKRALIRIAKVKDDDIQKDIENSRRVINRSTRVTNHLSMSQPLMNLRRPPLMRKQN
jgi:ABC-type dipeptide/oligopeptide/nickel transport system ATPase subunit